MKNFIQTKVLSTPLIGTKTKDMAWTIGLVAVAVIAPALLAHTPQNQWITGTLVNAILFLAAYQIPFGNAFLIAAVPSSIALSRGLLPLPMAMLIPYIILSNTFLVIVFKWLNKKPLVGVLSASFIKFIFLYSLTLILTSHVGLNAKMLAMFSYPQLITALTGGFVFLGLIKLFKKS